MPNQIEEDHSDCNLRLVWASVEQKIEISIAKSGFRLAQPLLQNNNDV